MQLFAISSETNSNQFLMTSTLIYQLLCWNFNEILQNYFGRDLTQRLQRME